MNNFRCRGVFIFMLVFAGMLFSSTAMAKFEQVVKPDKSYDFKAVDKIVIMPFTSNNVDFGKVDQDRLPKIKNLLEKTKEILRKQMVEGMNLSKPNKKFYYKASARSSKTLLLQSDIEKFDNGNMATRTLSPFGGKAKVTIRTKFMDGKTKNVIAEVLSSAKGSGGLVGGGLDSESLYIAAKTADAKTFIFMKKLTGLEYTATANLKEKAKMGIKDETSVLKEEKHEADNVKNKRK